MIFVFFIHTNCLFKVKPTFFALPNFFIRTLRDVGLYLKRVLKAPARQAQMQYILLKRQIFLISSQ